MLAQYLLSIGDGRYPRTELPDVITLPDCITCTETFQEMKGKIYPNLQGYKQDESGLQSVLSWHH